MKNMNTMSQRNGADRRRGFTLVELLVAMALIIFIMVVLSESFAAAMKSFRDLKALGDLGERLRAASTMLRRDLQADHFDGRKRVSEITTAQGAPRPREGFFTYTFGGSIGEGNDANANPSYRSGATGGAVLHFAIKLRGNERQQFASAAPPTGSPLLTLVNGTFFDQPVDARFMGVPDEYHSAWAEVRYFLARITDQNGALAAAPQGNPAGTPLFALFRSQLVVLPDNRFINSWNGNPPTPGPVAASELPNYSEFSCYPNPNGDGTLYFNNPTDLMIPAYRAFGRRGTFDPTNPHFWGATMLVTDVVAFDLEVLLRDLRSTVAPTWNWNRSDGWTGSDASVDSTQTLTFNVPSNLSLRAVKITLRVWDVKTNQSRQITVIQDL